MCWHNLTGNVFMFHQKKNLTGNRKHLTYIFLVRCCSIYTSGSDVCCNPNGINQLMHPPSKEGIRKLLLCFLNPVLTMGKFDATLQLSKTLNFPSKTSLIYELGTH